MTSIEPHEDHASCMMHPSPRKFDISSPPTNMWPTPTEWSLVIKIPFTAAIALLLAFLAAVIKRVYLHPLSRYPGPKLWAASRVPYVWAMWSGQLAHRIKHFHEQYGPAIRLAPDELSFISPDACRDILARRPDGTAFAKNPIWVPPPGPQKPTTILNAPDEEHQRIRRAWSYGFSDQSLKAQEPLISKEVDKLMERLREQTTLKEVDIAKWFGFCIFDISGSLTFGASYGCLDSAALHESLSLATYSIKASVLMAACRYFPLLFKLMMWTIARTAQSKQKQHISFSQQKVRERLQNPTGRPDFLYHMQSSSRTLSDKEIEANAGVIASASTNTTNTTLLGTVTFLLRFPETLSRLTHEIRQTFNSNEDINLESLMKLPYLSAVIEEGLRIVSPIPLGTPRVVPHPGATICGEVIPGGTYVAYMQWAANLSPSNFTKPEEFIPSRWLDPSVFPEAEPFGQDQREATQPFNLGPRDCIGRKLAHFELRLILAKLVFNFDLSLPGGPGSGLKWEEQETFVIWSKRPFHVVLRSVR